MKRKKLLKLGQKAQLLAFAVTWESTGAGIQGVSTDIVFRCVALACVLKGLFKKQSKKTGIVCS